MTTPTTPEQAREIAMHLFFPNGNNGNALKSLASQVEALTRERDDLKAIVAGKIETIALYRVEMLKACKERDFLAIANKDLSEAMNQYQQLQAAAKLALDLINDLEPLYWDTNKDKRRHTDAVAALREALK